jgi:hypothetical protein
VAVSLLLIITVPLAYLLRNNVGFEKVRVMKNKTMASDVDASGNVILLIEQYYTEFIGYNSANAFIKEKGIEGYYRWNANEPGSDSYHRDLFIVKKDPRTSTMEWHLLRKNFNWTSVVIKIFDNEIHVAWAEFYYSPSTLYPSQIKYGKIDGNFVLNEICYINKTRSMYMPISMEVLPNPTRVLIGYYQCLFLVDGTKVSKMAVDGPEGLVKDSKGDLHILGFDRICGVSGCDYHLELDNGLNIVRRNNISINESHYLFQINDALYLFYYSYWDNYLAANARYFVHPVQDGPINETDANNLMIDNITSHYWDTVPDYSIAPIVVNDRLLLFYGRNEGNYPMMMREYDTSNNFHPEGPKYFNFTVRAVHSIGNDTYLVGFENRWTYQKDFPQIIIMKI